MQLNPVNLTNPKDHEGILNHMNQARRVGLFDEFLVAVLLHRFWKKLLPETRLAVSLAIEEKLGEQFQFLSVEKYHAKKVNQFISRYLFKPNNLIMHVIPGSDKARIVPFLISQRQVNWTQFTGTLEPIGSRAVTYQSYDDIMDWLESHPTLRLPSELEFQYASRSLTKTKYYWGNQFDREHCLLDLEAPEVVANSAHLNNLTNGFGLIGTLGSRAEFCADHWNDLPPGERTQSPYRRQRRLFDWFRNLKVVVKGDVPKSTYKAVKTDGRGNIIEVQQTTPEYRDSVIQTEKQAFCTFRVAATLVALSDPT